MNHIQEITNQCQCLPEDLQKQVLDYIYFLEARYSKNTLKQANRLLSDEELEQACGILTAPYGVSLEEMDVAIESRRKKL